ncbi:hypothetical protein Salmi_Mp129 (mitochondrion) [Salvia miltiorrhiza]|uniref:Uncharacterized protein n=1 Tax=Salvia miltiorrhiza TaxID=226208 RepID=V9P5N7_SALMI|nr:hypothetical protein Salmi_Mp129 [Salvia miltiorrhiza]AGU16657.1 hypothetical protein Salmi_Mp129 [Salvia miltiorrhiza]
MGCLFYFSSTILMNLWGESPFFFDRLALKTDLPLLNWYQKGILTTSLAISPFLLRTTFATCLHTQDLRKKNWLFSSTFPLISSENASFPFSLATRLYYIR